DPACRYLDTQYMLGGSLLIAPVFREDNTVEYYLPKGRWTNLLTGRLTEGDQWRNETLDFMQVPLFGREDSIIPTSTNAQRPAWTTDDELILQIMHVTDGADISVRACPTDGATPATFRCQRKGSELTFQSNGQATSVKV